MADTQLADYALITVAEYFEFKGISEADENVNEGHLHRLINSISKRIESHCRRIITPVTDVTDEEFSGDGRERYYVQNFRLNATPTLYYWNGTEWTEMTADSYPRQYHEDGYVWWSDCSVFTRRTKYKIDYSTGYARESVRGDIKYACIIMLQRAIKRTEQGKEGHRSESHGDVTTGFELTLMPADVRVMLAPYKRIM